VVVVVLVTTIAKIELVKEMRWAKHVARVGGRKIHVGGGSLNKIDDSEDLGVDGSVMFR
jgi:hypothetical protein